MSPRMLTLTRFRRRLAVAFLAPVVLAAGALSATPARAADTTEGLLLWYKLDNSSGAVATDSSGNGRDGTVGGTAAWAGAGGLTFDGSSTYVQAPNNLMAGLESITVSFDVKINTAQGTPYFLYGFGNSSGGSGNGYLFTTGNHFRTAITTGNWSGEQNTRQSTSYNLARGGWKHVTYTQTGGTGILYEDGVEIGRNTAITVTPGAIGGGVTTANYLGRSLYSSDRYLNGAMRDFRVYNRALAAADVEALALPYNTEVVMADATALSLGDTSAVTANLTLPATGPNGTAVTWATSDDSVVSSSGVITRPAAGQPAAHATLTATLKRATISDTKTFDVTVLAEPDNQGTAEAAAAALSVRNLGDARGNLTLPATGENGTTVGWSSARPEIISDTGEVRRPAPGAGAATVELTATVRKNAATATRVFTATVPELPVPKDYAGYLFSYFIGSNEQVYFALSHGNNALNWRELNAGQPVLTSTLGDKGARDPFIIRSPEGDKFYQIATDLLINDDGNWDASQRTGSKSILVWESTDLVHWTNERLVQVSPDTAGNTWAPEAYWDDNLGAYVVFWASKIYAESDPNHTGDTYNKMMYATTRDFYTFSAPQVWNDPGYSVIDSTVIKNNDAFYRFTKDERSSSSTPCNKFIIEEKSTELRSTDWDHVKDCIGSGSISQGEGPLVFKSNVEEKWYLFIDEFGGRGYVPFETTDLDSGVWTVPASYSLPGNPRHGTVLPVTADEYDKLLRAYAPDQIVVSLQDVAVTTGAGQAPVLPATVPATYADGVQRSATVTWDAVPAEAYAEVGTFTVAGTLTDDAPGRAKATVTVQRDPVPTSHLVLRYQFDETAGVVARDSSGRGYDGTYARTPAWGTGVQGGSFKMSGGGSSSTTAPYVTIPNGVLKDATGVTVSTWAKWSSSSTVNQWIYSLGPNSTKYLFTTPSNGSQVLYSATTTGSWQTEHRLASSAALPGGSWQHVAVTVDSAGQTAVMYLNGIKVASATGVTVKPSDLYDATKSYSGYVGRSLYSADPYFAGEVDDFRIYDAALSAAEILELAGKTTSVGAVALPELKIDAIVDDPAGTIKLPVAEGTSVTALAPSFTLAAGSTISPASGTVRDFTHPVTYTVTGSDGKTRVWTVQALVMKSPVLPGLYADPNIAVFGDTFYLYPTTDGFDGWSGTQFHAFSSKDLVHWTDHGVILDLGPDVTWADNSAWAPTIAERNGKYYFYFSGGMATGDTGKHLGVAVSDSPAGPFTDALGAPLVAAGTYGGQMIDSAVFTDDDGQSYLYWGNGYSYQVPLNDDMVSFDATKVKTYKPTNYNEGSFVIKRGGTYYFMWSENDTRSADYRVAYATGTSPTGPWSDRVGVILAKDAGLGINGTGHHSVVRVPGSDDWYIAYHRFAMPGGDGMHRETTIDRMLFNADGTIRPVVPTLESVDPVSIAHAGPDVSGTEGVAVTLTGSISGAEAPVTWSYTSDGGGTCSFADPGATRTAFTCTDDGTYRVTLTAGGSSDTAVVTLANAKPVLTSVTWPEGPIALRSAVTVRATVVDLGGTDSHSCRVDWQDGTTSQVRAAGGVCRAEHGYAKPGVYQPSLTVTDDDGGAASAGTERYVAAYDPGKPYLAGAGTVDSAAGAYCPKPTLVGPATFGIVAGRPGRGGAGELELRYRFGNLTFSAAAYKKAAIGGGEVRYEGKGAFNGTEGYGYQVSLTDESRHRGGADRFWIRITDPKTGRVVYDSRIGARGTALTSGDIINRLP